MKAMILAAGHGKRMGPLTQSKPKPLLEVNGITLLENKIICLQQAGINEFVINVAYLPEQIKAMAGDGSQWGVNIRYSEEDDALETAGGICKALPLLGDQPFIAVNADIWTNYAFEHLVSSAFIEKFIEQNRLGHLVMVDNPAEHPQGDFMLDDHGLLCEKNNGKPGLTYSGVAVYHPELFLHYPEKRLRFPLLEVFHYAINKKQLSGEYYSGVWEDIGTPERLKSINAKINKAANDD